MGKGRHGKQKKKHVGLVVVLVLLIVIAISGYVGYHHVLDYVKNYDAIYKEGSTALIRFEVPSGATTTKIANLLEEQGIIEDAKMFTYCVRLNELDGKFQAGTFDLSAGMGTQEIMKSLQHAYRETKKFTIPEGYTIEQTAEKLTEDGLIGSPEEFCKALTDGDYQYWFVEELGQDDVHSLEGFLYPNTYEVYVDATAEDIINKMLAGFNYIYSESYMTKAKNLGLSLKEAITVASLIEEETRTAEERPLVASVVYNRLEINMPLQFCSTVLYSLGEWKARLLYSDLEVDSPYNTYKNEGLPPGPISSPGKASIEAALNPADTDYLYFVLKGDGSGTHNFAKDYNSFANYKEEYLNTFN